MSYTIHFAEYPDYRLNINNIYGYVPENIIQAELVFNTAMNGYIESFTDPSYYNQAIVFTYPSIGNYGMPNAQNFYTPKQHKLLLDNGQCKSTYLPYLEFNFESNKIQPKFIIVEKFVNNTANSTLNNWFKKHKVPILEISNVKPIVKFIRDNGSQHVCLTYNEHEHIHIPNDFKWINFDSINYQANVSVKSSNIYQGFILNDKYNSNNANNSSANKASKPLLFIDFGCKYSQIREFIARGITVYRVPWNYIVSDELTASEIIELYSGLFLSSGPGNPNAPYIKPVIQKLNKLITEIKTLNIVDFPIFGVCFGHQILGQSMGYEIAKLPYGHRGIHHPVKLSNNSNKGYITSQNHGYYLKLDETSHIKSLFIHGFDNTNQGLYSVYYPIYSVQFHPEACPGPTDTLWLFDYYSMVLTYKYMNIGNVCNYIINYIDNVKLDNVKLDNIKQINKILLIGSGGLQIGQAGEFDYSCSQAIKAYQSLGIKVILLNPNVATIQTILADQTYYLPLTEKYLMEVIEKQQPDAISYAFGGQTSLNLCINAYNNGLLNNIHILGSTLKDCINCEDRQCFINTISYNGLSKYVIPSITLTNDLANNDIINNISNNIGYPLLLRNSMALGGAGSCIIKSDYELLNYLANNTNKTGIELCKSILGWKEIELEVMRDYYGNTCVMCGMENIDPVGFHTGESLVVAPCQTLNNRILQECRTAAIQCAKAFNLIGEGNVQFAIHPQTDEIKIIEMNPRLSRSSALASKATAYPIAYIAAKLQLGYSLLEIQNENVEGHENISAFYEPVLDYFAVKMPRWDIDKLPGLQDEIGTAMKSVGEVLTISRKLSTAIINAMIASGNFNKDEISFNINTDKDTSSYLTYYADKKNTTRRWIAIYNLIKNNLAEHIDIKINGYFINVISDWFNSIDDMQQQTHEQNDQNYQNKHIDFTTIDSFAGEIPTKSNYRYLTPIYDNTFYKVSIDNACDNSIAHSIFNDITKIKYNDEIDNIKQDKKYNGKVIIIGSGAYCIGSSVEFDWCCVSAAKRAMELGYYVVMINSNPETVSTDFTECDCLYMEDPNIENLKNIYKIETRLSREQGINMLGVIISMGGQKSNNLVNECVKEGINILGTTPHMIDMAEDRNKFSALLDKLKIDQPEWINARNLTEVLEFCERVKYPCIVRPSYVLSGAYMYIVNSRDECIKKLETVKQYNDTNITVSKFIEKAKEIDVDCISDEGNILAMSISEHVNHGVHSGDDILISPAQTLNLETLKKIKSIMHTLSINLEVSGPFNCQLLTSNDDIKVIECNLRSSRTIPFISTLYKYNYIYLATDIILDSYSKLNNQYDFNKRLDVINIPRELTSLKKNKIQTVGIKFPMFSFHGFSEMDQNLSVTMKSTGMIGVFSKSWLKCYLRGLESVNFRLPKSIYGGKLLLMCSPSMINSIDKYLLMYKKHNWSINKLETKKYEFTEYDLIFYINYNYQYVTKKENLEINKLTTVIRTRNEIKIFTQALFNSLDKI